MGRDGGKLVNGGRGDGGRRSITARDWTLAASLAQNALTAGGSGAFAGALDEFHAFINSCTRAGMRLSQRSW